MPRVCSPETITGTLLGEATNHGANLSQASLQGMNSTATAAVFDRVEKRLAGQVDDSLTPDDTKAIEMFGTPRNGVELAKATVAVQRNASMSLGEDTVLPVQKAIERHIAKYGDDASKETKAAYKVAMQEVFDGIDKETIPQKHQALYQRYKQFYLKEGGPLFRPPVTDPAAIAVNNFKYNVLRASSTIIFGNPVEATIKLPALYGTNAVKGLMDATKAGLFSEVPEMKAKGIYGYHDFGDKKSRWDKILGFTDTATRNVAYFTGKASGGEDEGARAIQRALFVPRLGDLPEAYWNNKSMSQSLYGFLNYTVNTYRFYGSLLHKAATGDTKAMAGLTYALGASAAIGGISGIPGFGLLETLNPDYADELKSGDYGKTPLTNLVRLGNIDSVFIVPSMVDNKIKEINKDAEKAKLALDEGDFTNTAFALGDMGLKASMPLTRGWWADPSIQRALKLAQKMVNDDLDDDFSVEAREALLPFTKQYK